MDMCKLRLPRIMHEMLRKEMLKIQQSLLIEWFDQKVRIILTDSIALRAIKPQHINQCPNYNLKAKQKL